MDSSATGRSRPDLVDSSTRKWLQANRNLRMDANRDDFSEDRRDFHLERYRFASQFCHDKRVLDGACGTGYGSALIGEVAKQVVGIDCCERTVAYANQTYQSPQVSFQKQHVELTPFESASFDVVVSFETVEHTLCPKRHLWEMARLLKPSSGRAVLSVPNKWGLTPHHFFDFDHQLLEELTTACFERVTWYYQNSRSHPWREAPVGVGPLDEIDLANAECILAVCAGPRSEGEQVHRLHMTLDEIYESAFQRHREYLAMLQKEREHAHRLQMTHGESASTRRRQRSRPLKRLGRLIRKWWPGGGSAR